VSLSKSIHDPFLKKPKHQFFTSSSHQHHSKGANYAKTYFNDPPEFSVNTSPSRRAFVVRIASFSAALAAGAGLSACGGDPAQAEFNFGVASGDPLADKVILWTHAKFPGNDAEVPLRYQVAKDAAFTQVVSQGDALASMASGFTAKVDAGGLQAGTAYFFRFSQGTNPVSYTHLRAHETEL
jgi:phosphodiesterase/alkaline phosphatase D-like protein